MSEGVLHGERYEFFSWRGFAVGAAIIGVSLLIQASIGFPDVWTESPITYLMLIAASALVVGISSGAVLVYLVTPNQDVIGLSGLGSDDATQHVALLLVLLALVQPVISGYLFFYEYFNSDPLAAIWVMVAFAAPTIGIIVGFFDRRAALVSDLKVYFLHNNRLDLAGLEWLQGLGPRTTTYRIGMLETAASRVRGVGLSGHEIVKEKSQAAVGS
ncbi:MAG: hypothetical protein C4K47_04520 [Candidatus Thorarchaeota archaeon]|nr:MAG: hypothetical protein C4K47_04520 [Candidatus Thorarchaeota archaeon]